MMPTPEREPLMQIDSATSLIAGIVLLSVATIAFGGTFLLRVATGAQPANALQTSFFRAGHAHAGVLVILGLLIQLFVDLADVGDVARALSLLILVAAIVMPAGFFCSVIGHDPQRPNGLVALIWIGAGCLVVGVIGAGIGLIAAA